MSVIGSPSGREAVAPARAATRPSAPRQRRVLVAVGGSAASVEEVRAACLFAEQMGAPWHAVHVETPQAGGGSSRSRAAEALGLAASLGATVVTIPAAEVIEGLVSQVEDQQATDLVIGWSAAATWRRWIRRPLAEQVATRCRELTIHLPPVPTDRVSPEAPDERAPSATRSTARSYLVASGFVMLTALLVEPVWRFVGVRGVDLLFLIPVIAASVRLGLRQGLLAALLSVLCYNFLFLRPLFRITVNAPQNLVMLAVLLGAALYTGMLSEQLRGRVRLSDRSAKENAAIAAFGQELARAADWEATAAIVCRAITGMLDVRVVLLREKRGKLVAVGAVPGPAAFGPVDRVALEWTWENGSESGRGTSHMAAADWQFHALATSLGTLALVALARDDGAPPVPADRAVLLSTLLAQAALAHERLRLEDQALESAIKAGHAPL